MTDPSAEAEASPRGVHEEPLLEFSVPLEEVIKGEDSTFRTQNQSMSDFERRSIIQRTQGNIHTRVDLLEVTHGNYENGGDEATLLVLRFRFDPQKHSSRVIRALVNIEFAASNTNEEAPVVDAIAPEEKWMVLPTTDQDSFTRGGEVSLGSSTFVEVGAKANLARTTTRDISDATTISGSINLGTGKNKGESTVAAWNFLENKSRKTGVPDSVKVAILLRRTTAKRFNAIVTLEADCDFVTGLQQRFGKFPLDDPILFNPTNTYAKVRKGRNYRVDNLGETNLDGLCDVRMAVQAPFAR